MNRIDPILIVGGDGKIGSYLRHYLKKNSLEVFSTTRGSKKNKSQFYLDLSQENIVFPDRIFNSAVFCAGITEESYCEQFPIQSKIINVDRTIHVVKRLLDQGTRVIFLSSNKVFDGTKQFYDFYDEVSPISNYGRFKVDVEKFFSHPNFSILRLTKVITKSSAFIINWEKQLKNLENNKIIAFNNHYISPITLNDVSDAVRLILESRLNGIFHLGSSIELSYYDFAITYFSTNKKALDLITGERDPNINGIKFNSLRRYLPE